MKKIHNNLMRKNGAYAKWHSDPSHNITHWLFLFVFVIGGFLLFGASSRNTLSHLDRGFSLAQVSSSITTNSQINEAKTLTREVLELSTEYEQDSSQATLSELETTLQDREELLVTLIEKNKIDEVLNLTLSDSDRSRLPASVQDSLEEQVVVEGTYEWIHGDNLTTGKEYNRHTVLTDSGEEYTIVYSDEIPSVLSGDEVVIEAYALADEYLIVDTEANTNALDITSIDTSVAQTQKKVGVILFNFQNDQDQPFTTAQAKSTVFTSQTSVNAYFFENSFSKWGLKGVTDPTGDVFGWYTIPTTVGSTCNFSQWADLANAEAQEAGAPISQYDHIIYAFPKTSSCTWQGLASMGGVRSWINSDSFPMGTVAHELGHNFNFHHATSLSCVDTTTNTRVPLGGTCTQQTYGDPFSVMGQSSARKHVSVYNKGLPKAGVPWFISANTKTLTPENNPEGTYLVRPANQISTGTQSLRIAKTTGTYYYVEYRKPAGLFESYGSNASEMTNGVIVRLAPDYSSSSVSQLLDMTPATTTMADAPLNVGQTFFDATSGISIELVSITEEGANVRVDFTGSASGASVVTGAAASGVCHQNPPNFIITYPSGEANSNVKTYNISVTNWSSPSCEPAPIEISAVLPTGWTMSPESITEEIRPQVGISRTFFITPVEGVVNGSYPVTFKAKNLAPSNTINQQTQTVTHVITGAPAAIGQLQITSPTNGNTYTGNLNISVNKLPLPTGALAVNTVEILVDNVVVHTCTSGSNCQKTILGSELTPGSHTISARGTNTSTGTTTNTSVSITKTGTTDTPVVPPITIETPVNGSTVAGDLTIKVVRSTASMLGATTKVYLDGVQVGDACAGNPCTKKVLGSSSSLLPGAHTVTVKNFNSSGQETASVTSTITKTGTTSSSNPIPVVIQSPAAGAVISGDSFPLTLYVADFANRVGKVYLNGQYVGGCPSQVDPLSNPCTFTVSAMQLQDGVNTLTAASMRKFATAPDSQTFTSMQITKGEVTVNAGAASIASITAPANGALFTGPMTVTATNTNPSTYAVRIYLDNQSKGYCQGATQTTCTAYIPTWSTGAHTIKLETIKKSNNVVENIKTISVTKATEGSILSFSSPAQNARIAGDLTITANTTSPATYNTQLYFNDVLKKTCESGSSCSVVVPGSDITHNSHSVHIKAVRKSDGAVMETLTRTITKLIPGSVAITNPTNGSTITGSMQVTTAVTMASTNYELNIKMNGQNQNWCGAAHPNCGFSLNYDQLPSGTHTITATLREWFNGIAGPVLDTETITFYKD